MNSFLSVSKDLKQDIFTNLCIKEVPEVFKWLNIQSNYSSNS